MLELAERETLVCFHERIRDFVSGECRRPVDTFAVRPVDQREGRDLTMVRQFLIGFEFRHLGRRRQ